MSYSTIDDVNGLLVGFEITKNSSISIDQVNNDIIPMGDQYIDDRLGKFYQTPITGEKALITIRRISKLLAAAEVTQRLYIGQTPANSPQASTWRTYADKDLDRIIDGEILLSDAVPTADTPKAKSHLIKDNLSQPTYQIPSRFSMGMKF